MWFCWKSSNKENKIHPKLAKIIRWQYEYYRLNKNIDKLYIKY